MDGTLQTLIIFWAVSGGLVAVIGIVIEVTEWRQRRRLYRRARKVALRHKA